MTAEVELLAAQGKAYVEASKERLLSCIAEADEPTKQFIMRVLNWKTDTVNDGHQKLWELFHEVIDTSPPNFLDSFHSFVVNCLLDDDAFLVEWRKPLVNDDGMLVWNRDGSMKTVIVDKDDPRAHPVVVRTGDGSQNVSLLMEAMDHKDWEVKRREELEEEKLELLARFKK